MLQRVSYDRFREPSYVEPDYTGIEIAIRVEQVPLRLYRDAYEDGPVVALIDGTVTLEGMDRGDYRVASVTMEDAATGRVSQVDRTGRELSPLIYELLCKAADEVADERFMAEVVGG
jgi:hypothetical protein